MPSDGDGQEYRPPGPSHRLLGDFVVPKEMPGGRRGPKLLDASPRREVERDFLESLGLITSDSNGREYRPPHLAQKLRREFVIAEEIPVHGDGQRCWPLRPAMKLRVTS